MSDVTSAATATPMAPVTYIVTFSNGKTGQSTLYTASAQANPLAYLQAALGDAGLTIAPYVPPVTNPTIPLIAHASSKQQGLLAAGIMVNVAASGAPAVNVLCDGTGSTAGHVALGVQWAQMPSPPILTKQWLDNNGVSTSLTPAEWIAMAVAVGTWTDNLYTALGTVIAQIKAGTITTTAQIDAYAWPTS